MAIQDKISLLECSLPEDRLVFIPQKERFNLGMLLEHPEPSEVLEESYLGIGTTLGMKSTWFPILWIA